MNSFSEHDSPYEALADAVDDAHRWAFGTGFVDPLAGIDTSVPAGVDAYALAARCLALGDDALIYSHRLQQWITRLPELEEETAIANIALDLLGQARMLLARAGSILGHSEDELAFFRTEHEFRNVRMVEHLDRDFAELVVRLLIFSCWRLSQFDQLARDEDPVLAAIATRAINELVYHREYAAMWVVRLGDGTELSNAKVRAALDAVWPLVDELFQPVPGVLEGPGRAGFDAELDTVLATAAVPAPQASALAAVGGRAGRAGVHTEALGYVLAEMQSVARAHPRATW